VRYGRWKREARRLRSSYERAKARPVRAEAFTTPHDAIAHIATFGGVLEISDYVVLDASTGTVEDGTEPLRVKGA